MRGQRERSKPITNHGMQRTAAAACARFFPSLSLSHFPIVGFHDAHEPSSLRL
jgi:hypothetical protein